MSYTNGKYYNIDVIDEINNDRWLYRNFLLYIEDEGAQHKEVLNEQYEKYTLDTFCVITSISHKGDIYIGQPDMGLSDFGL